MAETRKSFPSPITSNIQEGRMPPQSIDAEMTVLGSLMLDREAMYRVADMLSVRDFYKPAHQLIYEAMLDLFKQQEPIDVLSVSSRLHEKGILEDVNQHPVIRVALRALKDFAIPFKKDNQVFWRYFTFSEESVREKIEGPIEIKKHEIEAPKAEEAESALKKQIEEKNNETKENIKEKETKEKPKVKIKLKPLADEKFLNEIKGILERKKIELLAIESFDRKQVFAKVKLNNQDHFFAAYDKKRIDDEDLFKAYKKAQILGLPYSILAKGDTSKKTKEAIDAYKKLASIEKIENSDNLEQ